MKEVCKATSNPNRLTKPRFEETIMKMEKVIKDLTECKRCSELEIVDSSRGDEVPSSKGGKTIRKPLLFHFQFSDCRHPPQLPFPFELVTVQGRRNWGVGAATTLPDFGPNRRKA